MIDDGGPADPTVDQNRAEDYGTRGMTLRDYFAAAAMQGWLASFGDNAAHPVHELLADEVAKMSYAMADEMILARGSK